MSGALLAALLVGGGLALVAVGMLTRLRERDRALAEILELPWGEKDVSVGSVSERSPLIEGTIGLAGRMVSQFDTRGSLSTALERARIPLRPGEYVMATAGIGVGLTIFLVAITQQWMFALLGVIAAVLGAAAIPRRRIEKRRRAFEEQLPDALSLVASSLSAGHTFLRAIQMMTEEAEAPLSEEFGRVVSETQLGDPLVEALDRMAQRLAIADLVWVVQAIRIQQTVGGKLADLLHTLADFIRAREELRREVQVLTAEGRMSAWILGGLPVGLLVAVQVISPDYLAPMFEGWGPYVLAGTGLSVGVGVAMIRRMVKIEV